MEMTQVTLCHFPPPFFFSFVFGIGETSLQSMMNGMVALIRDQVCWEKTKGPHVGHLPHVKSNWGEGEGERLLLCFSLLYFWSFP